MKVNESIPFLVVPQGISLIQILMALLSREQFQYDRLLLRLFRLMLLHFQELP